MRVQSPVTLDGIFDADAWDKLAEYHLGVSDAIDASVYSNTVKVAGPVDAYPYRDGSSGDFSSWANETNLLSIRLEIDWMRMRCMYMSRVMEKVAYEDQLELFQIWHLGRLPAFLDLWENEQVMTWGHTLPFVISDMGCWIIQLEIVMRFIKFVATMAFYYRCSIAPM